MYRFKFILYRPIQLIPVVIGISVISFLLLQAVPGDPVRTMLGQRATPEVVESLRSHYGLDKPVVVQYGIYIRNIFRGDLGNSIIYKIPVIELVSNRIVPTIFLILLSTLLAIFITCPLAIIAAKRQGFLPDHIIRVFSTVGLGFPAFWLGIMLILLLSVNLGWFPVAGYGETFLVKLHHMFLPSLTIALALSAILVRNLRASLLAETNSDYVVASRAKGIKSNWIFNHQIFPNSLLPTINLLGVNIGWLIGGTVVIESVFSIPGLGSLMIKSIFARDYYVVQFLTMTFAFSTVFVSFVVDIITVALDPRIKI